MIRELLDGRDRFRLWSACDFLSCFSLIRVSSAGGVCSNRLQSGMGELCGSLAVWRCRGKEKPIGGIAKRHRHTLPLYVRELRPARQTPRKPRLTLAELGRQLELATTLADGPRQIREFHTVLLSDANCNVASGASVRYPAWRESIQNRGGERREVAGKGGEN